MNKYSNRKERIRCSYESKYLNRIACIVLVYVKMYSLINISMRIGQKNSWFLFSEYSNNELLVNRSNKSLQNNEYTWILSDENTSCKYQFNNKFRRAIFNVWYFNGNKYLHCICLLKLIGGFQFLSYSDLLCFVMKNIYSFYENPIFLKVWMVRRQAGVLKDNFGWE